MLGFLRRYQRFVMATIGVVIVFSFLFFGIASRLQGMPSQIPDKVIGKAIDGSDLRLIETEQMVRFLSADYLDGHLLEKRGVPNFFNDGVMRKDFLETGLGSVIAKRYFEEIETELQERFEKAKNYRAYAHPQAPFLSASAIWAQFAPQMIEKIGLVQKMKFGPDTFDAMARVYVEQGGINGEMMRRILYQQQQQYQIPQDPMLLHADLGIFGAHSLEDWFGRRFLEIATQVICEGAAFAKQQGYRVSAQEARADLMNNGYQYLVAHRQGHGTVEGTDVADSFKRQLQMLHMDEQSAVKIWQKVMLFRRAFNEVGMSAFVDPLMQKQFDRFAHVGKKATVYRSQHHDLAAMIELYIQLTGAPTDGMPTQTKKDVPKELMEERFFVEVAHVTKDSVALRVPVKAMLKYELDADHWSDLKIQCKALGMANSREERLTELDRLPVPERAKLDSYVRGKIVDQHAEWISAALDDAEFQEQTLHLISGSEPLAGITNIDGIAEMLRTRSDKLSGFTDDHTNYYRIKVIEEGNGKELLTFREAVEAGVMEKLLNQRLEKLHATVRESAPDIFKKKDGSWKPWHEVKNAISERTLDREYKKRMDVFLKKIRGNLIDGDLQWVAQSREPALEKLPPKPDYTEQWKLEKREEILKRSGSHWYLASDILKHPEGWTTVQTSKRGDLYVAHIEDAMHSSEVTAANVKACQELLGRKAKTELLVDLLDHMKLISWRDV